LIKSGATNEAVTVLETPQKSQIAGIELSHGRAGRWYGRVIYVTYFSGHMNRFKQQLRIFMVWRLILYSSWRFYARVFYVRLLPMAGLFKIRLCMIKQDG